MRINPQVVLTEGFVISVPLPSGAEELDFPFRTCLTLVTDKSGAEDQVVEVRLPRTPGNRIPDGYITPEQLQDLIRLELVVAESSSGWDPELHYKYDHWEVV